MQPGDNVTTSGIPRPAHPYTSGQSNTNSSNSSNKTYDDFGSDWYGYLTYLVNKGDPAAIDKFFNYFMTESSLERSRQYQASREDTAYQRLMADLRASGVNPFALSTLGLSPISASSSSGSYSGSQFTSVNSAKETSRHNQETEQKEWLRTFLSMIPIVVGVAMLMI